jgi:hypothetical protein
MTNFRTIKEMEKQIRVYNKQQDAIVKKVNLEFKHHNEPYTIKREDGKYVMYNNTKRMSYHEARKVSESKQKQYYSLMCSLYSKTRDLEDQIESRRHQLRLIPINTKVNIVFYIDEDGRQQIDSIWSTRKKASDRKRRLLTKTDEYCEYSNTDRSGRKLVWVSNCNYSDNRKVY